MGGYAIGVLVLFMHELRNLLCDACAGAFTDAISRATLGNVEQAACAYPRRYWSVVLLAVLLCPTNVW